MMGKMRPVESIARRAEVALNGGMPKPEIYPEDFHFRAPAGTRARIADVQAGEPQADFLREAVEREISRRKRAKNRK